MEQGNLYQRIYSQGLGTPKIDVITRCVTAGILPASLPYQHCPSDGWMPGNISTNYVACAGLYDGGGPGAQGACYYDPFRPLCTSAPPGGNFGKKCGMGTGISYHAETPTTKGRRISMVTDGLSNTIMLGESLPDKGDPHLYSAITGGRGWATFDGGTGYHSVYAPINYPIISESTLSAACPNPQYNFWNWSVSNGFKSNHTGGVNFAFADGSVHFISQTIDQTTLIELGIMNDGLPVQAPF
jgi:prepilin-type processing-associated H-X9-DG protein